MRIISLALLLSLPAIVFANVQIQNGNMSADLNSEQLSNVLEAVQQQAGIKVAVDPEVGAQVISASFQNLPFAAGIKKLFEGTGINYVVIGDEHGATSLFVGASEKPGEGKGMLNPNGTAMPGRGVVQPVNPMPPMPPPPPSPNNGKPDNQKKNQTTPPAVSVPTGGGFTPNNGNNNNPNQNQQQVAPRPPIPPEEQAPPEDDENDNDQQPQ